MHERLTIPLGTQVITRVPVRNTDGTVRYPVGAVGTLIAAPGVAEDRYTVRFADGGAATLYRAELTIRKVHQRAGAIVAAPDADLWPFTIYRCVVGSRAYGLDDERSDTDVRGIYLPPASHHWSLGGVPEQLEDEATQTCIWELQKFLTLALKANPNVLETLFTPLVLHAAPIAVELLALRETFVTKLIYQTYNGYVLSQFRKLEQDLRSGGAIKPKHAMHLIRLLLSGIAALRDGVIPVDVGAQRAALLAIKNGSTSWADVNAWRLSLHQEFDAAYAASALPELPDAAQVNAFLVRARRMMVEESWT